jgi:hypothetical protein
VSSDRHPSSPSLLRRVAYASASALGMAVVLSMFGKTVESWVFWLFVGLAFVIALVIYQKVD